MYFIDASAIVMYVVCEPGWEKVRKFLSEGAVTLDLAIKEVANALWEKVQAWGS